MEDQYGISDLREFISRPMAAQFQPSFPSSLDFFSAQHHLHGLGGPAHQQPQEMVIMGRSMSDVGLDMLHNHQQYNSIATATAATATATATASIDFHHHRHHMFNSDLATTNAIRTTTFGDFDGGGARWPRQETLTLLEVRSRLDYRFKEANQKGPLWDEVARILCEEYGYQRTGKKCREKFENLYKYYKKTKEGKAGRQDGKHYRFFRQLDALYGDHNNPQIVRNVPNFHNNIDVIKNPTIRPTSLSLSNSSDYETSIENEESKKKKEKRSKKIWKGKIKEFVDKQMRKIMETQEAWIDKMMNTLENREKERIDREEERRKQENERIERENKFWANERAWIEARDSALINALEKISNGCTCCGGFHHHQYHHHDHHNHDHHV